MSELGKLFVIIGLLFVAFGVFLWSGIGKNWFGRLPGDIHFSRGNFSFYFPLATCLLVSVVLTVILRFFKK